MIAYLNELLWGRLLLFTLLPVGLLVTVWTRGVQFRHFGRMFAVLRQGFQHKTDQPSSFQALALSVAGRVGAGNIAGVAVALTLGGPGAIFWMWVVGLFGMATSFLECTLAQLFKQREPDGAFRGGPAYYISKGLRPRLGRAAMPLAALYSLLLLVTFGVAFIMLQSFAMTTSVEGAFAVPKIASGVVLAGLIGLVIFGGVRRITAVVEVIVPVMAVGYVLVVATVLIVRAPDVPGALATIVSSAFGFGPVVGGGMGAAILQGVRRGLFSNEAGLGSAPNVAAVAYVAHPAQQGLVQSLSVFIDTIVLCTCTALIILLSSIDPATSTNDGVVMTQVALAEHVGDWAESFVAVALFLFVVSSIMYSYYLGETAIDFFLQDNQTAFSTYRLVVIGMVLVGSTVDLAAAFGFADVTMGVLALVNLFALVLLLPVGVRVMRDFDRQVKNGRAPAFDVHAFADLDLDPSAWTLRPEDAANLETGKTPPQAGQS